MYVKIADITYRDGHIANRCSVCAGRTCVAVDPRNTTQMCSGCGQIVPKDLSVRVHDCPHCGLKLDRDHNAALNILARGLSCVQADSSVAGRSSPL